MRVAVAGLVPVMVGRDALVSVAVGCVPAGVWVADGVSELAGAGGRVGLGCAVSVRVGVNSGASVRVAVGASVAVSVWVVVADAVRDGTSVADAGGG